MDAQKLAPRFAIASAILFVTLVVMQTATGASQAYFEVVHPPGIYASQMVAHAWFRIVVALDNVFIAAYVGAATGPEGRLEGRERGRARRDADRNTTRNESRADARRSLAMAGRAITTQTGAMRCASGS